MKLVVCADTDRVLGCHIVADGAGEMIQLAGVALSVGATKAQFDATLAVHPTMAEELVTLRSPVRRIATLEFGVAGPTCPNADQPDGVLMSGNNGGPWGGGNRGGGNRGSGGGGQGGGGPRGGGQVPEIDEIVKKGQEQLRVLMGGRGGNNGGNGGGTGGPGFSKRGVLLGMAALVLAWAFASFYTVRPEERSVELLFGQYSQIGSPGLNFAPWPWSATRSCRSRPSA